MEVGGGLLARDLFPNTAMDLHMQCLFVYEHDDNDDIDTTPSTHHSLQPILSRRTRYT